MAGEASMPAAPLALVLVLALAAARGWGLRLSSVVVPPVVASGSRVVLTCSYEHSEELPQALYSVKWYRGVDQFYEFLPGRSPAMKVFPMEDIEVDETHSNLTSVVLVGVTRGSSGTYRCEVLGDKPYFETDDHAQNMTVVDVPTWGPHITGVSHGMRVKPDDVITAQCEVDASDPPADFTWLVNHREPTARFHVSQGGPTTKADQPVQMSVLEILPSKSFFERGAMTITCEVRVSTVFQRAVNVSLIDANWPQPAGVGLFSAGMSTSPSFGVTLGILVLRLL
ncbi:uncharacterized protein LOC122251594 [Penaeus japonicus]|uniref:uncharacterized protein LOC122251594 n=1 Tax=Penaeus japonicus TaxID=27405 RepID=UPI001C70CED0|nr:uncharacterized protein LOC122251594 [Penaeus japonicus]